MSDEARAEAERRYRLWLPTGDYEIDRENYSELDAEWQNAEAESHRQAFVAGAEWQDDQWGREEEAAAALEHAHQVGMRAQVRVAELEAEVARLNDALDAAHVRHGMATDWGARLQAKLAAVRALAVDQTVTRTDRRRRILAVIDGGDET